MAGCGAPGDVEPAGTALGIAVLGNELVEAEGFGVAADELQQGSVVGEGSRGNVGGAAEAVLTVSGAADNCVEGGGAVAAVDAEGLAPQLAQRVEGLGYQLPQVLHMLRTRLVGQAESPRRSGGCQLIQRKVFS